MPVGAISDVDALGDRPCKRHVKWFDPTKAMDSSSRRAETKICSSTSQLSSAGLSTLNEGQTVEFELVSNRGKTSAENLKVA